MGQVAASRVAGVAADGFVRKGIGQERMSDMIAGMTLARGAFAAALFLFGSAAWAEAGLFDGLAGSWKGDGSIAWNTGETEHMRCTAKYQVERDGNRLIQNLTCATDSTRLIIKSTVTFNPAAAAITGDWSETTYGVNGYVTGTASPGAVNARVLSSDSAHRFNARVTMATNGNTQTVTIAPKDFDVTNVAVTLKKGGGS